MGRESIPRNKYNHLKLEIMERISIKEFAQLRGFVQINKTIRTNVNTYPYVTFINAKNEAENVYFSIGGAEEIKAGQLFDKELASTFDIAMYQNEAGEERVKLCRKGGDRVSIEDLF
jgi:hypothetical protein